MKKILIINIWAFTIVTKHYTFLMISNGCVVGHVRISLYHGYYYKSETRNQHFIHGIMQKFILQMISMNFVFRGTHIFSSLAYNYVRFRFLLLQPLKTLMI